MNILVLGRHGQLGQSLEDILLKTYPNSIFWDRQSLDLQQFDDIEHQLTAQRPDVIVNATAPQQSIRQSQTRSWPSL